MAMQVRRYGWFLVLAPLLYGCTSGAQGDVAYYYRDVEPVLQQKCQSCHVPGGIAPFSLMTIDDARRHAEAVVAAVHSDEMPPWPPGKDGLPLRDDRSLTDEQKQKIENWVIA